MNIVKVIKDKLMEYGGETDLPMLKKDKVFHVKLTVEGVIVSNLDKEPLLPWLVFEKVIELLIKEGGTVEKGDAMLFKLGASGLPINSIEGYIAKEVYGKQIGDSVFRRISPITNILIWVGLCKNEKGKLTLI